MVTDAQPNVYRLIGSEASAYSVKVRNYLTSKGIAFTWLTRAEAGELFAEHARLPRVPLLITPAGTGIHYSTEIIASVEADHVQPLLQPQDPTSRFMCALLEEFADEWASRWVEHYRWAREQDSVEYVAELVELAEPRPAGAQIPTEPRIREQLMAPSWFQAAPPAQTKIIEGSFKDSLDLLDPHLKQHPFLFGSRPALADFALAAQLAAALKGPTPRSFMELLAPNILAWLERVDSAADVPEGATFAPWEQVAETLGALLRDQVGGLFLPWSVANLRAVADTARSFTVHLRGESWQQGAQRYAAESFRTLRGQYQALSEDAALADALREHSCLDWLSI